MTYQDEIQRWRDQMEASLRAEDGWLTLAGLFWLGEGPNRFGSDLANQIVLPAGAPGYAGCFEFQGGEITLHAAPGAGVTLNGRPAGAARVQPDAGGAPDLVGIGALTLLIIRRGSRYGVRVRDRNSPVRAAFAGRRWYPIRAEYCLTARWVAHEPPLLLPIADILGDTNDVPSPGYVAFTLDGQERQLVATVERDQLSFNFRDLTNGRTTYPAGRFLKAALPRDGRVTLDFNKAYSPPCAFTTFATCPLPPAQNRLPLAIEAGELYEPHE